MERPYRAPEGAMVFTRAAGDTIGVLTVPEAGPVVELALVRGGRVRDRRFLTIPRGDDGAPAPAEPGRADAGAPAWRASLLALSSDGEVAVLRTAADLLVYEGAALRHRFPALFPDAAVAGGFLYWCPEPVPQAGAAAPPLLARSALDGSDV
jgi:hypothetical protein